jgi:hypothetical protein
LLTIILTGCGALSSSFGWPNRQVQTVDMGQFLGLNTIELAKLTFVQQSQFTHIDQANFSQSLIQSLQHSAVQVLPSAHTKLFITFTQIEMIQQQAQFSLLLKAKVIISRNGNSKQQAIEVNLAPQKTQSEAKTQSVEAFILDLAKWLAQRWGDKR